MRHLHQQRFRRLPSRLRRARAEFRNHPTRGTFSVTFETAGTFPYHSAFTREWWAGHGEVIALAHRDTLGGFLETVSSSEGVYLCDLPPCTSLLVWTLNSLYRIVIMQSPDVTVQGGAFFPEPTDARLVGSSRVPGGLLKVGWIGVGLRIELRSRDQYVVTSAVRAITRTDPPAA